MDSGSNFVLFCRSLGIYGTFIKIKCQTNTNSYVTMFTYSYFVFDDSFYNNPVNSILVK